MDKVSVEVADGKAVVRLANGQKNPLDEELVRQMLDTIEALGDDPSVEGLVLASASERFFSLGLDLPSLIDLDRDAMAEFLLALDDLVLAIYSLPKPTVAAVTGHAVAGGCCLALGCDHRVIAEGRTLMGLNEVKLGLTVPYPVDTIARNELGTRTARRLVETGDFLGPDDLAELGIVDTVVPREEVLEAAISLVADRAAGQSYASVKANRTEAVLEACRSNAADGRETFLDLWFSPPTQANLREALEKF